MIDGGTYPSHSHCCFDNRFELERIWEDCNHEIFNRNSNRLRADIGVRRNGVCRKLFKLEGGVCETLHCC